MEAQSADGSTTYQSYYSLLGIRRNASLAEIRVAYRKLALKWHPDRRGKESPEAAGEAKLRFQRIQEAYSGEQCGFNIGVALFTHAILLSQPFSVGDALMHSGVTAVLADNGKRAMYDAGLFDPFDDDDQDFTDFMVEMLSMMESRTPEKPDSLEDLQKIFNEMVNGMEMGLGPSVGRKRARVE